MTPEQFCYWLQGFCEMNGGKEPTTEQWNMINDHLRTVFFKVTPPLTPLSPVNPNKYYDNPAQFNTPAVC